MDATDESADDQLARLDREWLVEREAYLVRGRMGRLYRPTYAASVLMVLIGGSIGGLWTFFAMLAGGTGVAALMPVLGVMFTLLAVTFGMLSFVKARRYTVAERAYRERRQRAERVA